ncbi:glycerol kinase [Advenella kashmirensis WT001]|uniref:Glycerol kinase n=1 Tax=Advenella kashmirensis (strain DSM 17095 / LMG 22695 / WT001) TaxID=1036672 RepID=I3U875_ADVKW|nr:glycerol kinase GlpK [Advenella kashmirensis]AFK61213.1 glycerol kinase [Advenella kashmirensis WT001]
MDYLLALDQGTSSSRSILFDRNGQIVGLAQQEFTQHYPQSGWVEHDALEIWRTQLVTMQKVLHQSAVDIARVRAVGITNQRETSVLWDRATGQPLGPAIVWQDRRGEPLCRQLRDQGHEPMILEKTGLRLDAYFSATKLAWMLEHLPQARARADKGELLFGTIDSWLIWQLTGGKVHATDVTNASRTMLFNVHTGQWDSQLLDLFQIPPSLLPQVMPSSAHYGDIPADLLGYALPICGVAGDQHSALFGQACTRAGMAKNTYGTGCFALLHTGTRFTASENGLLTTRVAQYGQQQPEFALEGSVFVAGAAVQWLRDGLGIIKRSRDVQALAQSVPDTGGVMFVPAFTGLGAPYWKADARGTLVGINRATTAAHIARAAVESIAYQSAALLSAMARDGVGLEQLRVDGGASVNDALMQFQADLLGIPVLRPQVVETTALGAAYLAGLQSGIWSDVEQIEQLWRIDKTFEPAMSRDQAQACMQQWEKAVAQTICGT